MLPQIVELFEAHWLENQESDAYHSDLTAVSSTGLRKMLKSPKAFYAYCHEPKAEPTRDMRIGHLIHMVLLEPWKFNERCVVDKGFGDLRSATHRKAREEWKNTLALDATIVSQDEYDDLRRIVDSVHSHRDACKLLRNGKPEMSGFYRDETTGIKCKIKPDYLNTQLMALIDVKSTKDCSMAEFQKSIWNYRYDFQLGMYIDGIRNITKKDVNYAIFLVIEKQAPFEVALYVADTVALTKGYESYRAALDSLHACLTTNQWSRYQESLQTISLPPWAVERIG